MSKVPQPTKSAESSPLPIHVIKYGEVQASIWQNETKFGTRFNVTVSRRYKENGDWKRSQSFGREELLTVAKAMNEAHTWIWSRPKAEPSDVQQ